MLPKDVTFCFCGELINCRAHSNEITKEVGTEAKQLNLNI